MNDGSLKVYMFNVGAGDHIMLEFPDGSLGIIDSFYTFENLKLQEPPALTYLKYRVAKERLKEQPGKVVISFLCLSHADIDHVKEINLLFSFILREHDIVVLENFWLFGGYSDTITQYKGEIESIRRRILEKLEGEQREEISISTSRYIDCLDNINKFKAEWNGLQKRTEYYFTDFHCITRYGNKEIYKAYSLGPIASITNKLTNSAVSSLFRQLFEKIHEFCNPLRDDESITIESKINRNSLSAILGIHFGEYNLIFGGDATGESLEASLDDIPERASKEDPDLFNPDFYKASHHGSKHSSSSSIWSKLYPSPKGDLLIGVSAGLKHEHPHEGFLNDVLECCNVKQVGANVFRTNQCSRYCNACTIKDNGAIDLDEWFQYHGCELSDGKLREAFFEERSKIRGTAGQGSDPDKKNFLAYIFTFPAGGKNADIKVHRGVSEKIGEYGKCQVHKK